MPVECRLYVVHSNLTNRRDQGGLIIAAILICHHFVPTMCMQCSMLIDVYKGTRIIPSSQSHSRETSGYR